MKIFIIAGEESGDILGADLMQSLQNKYKGKDITFRGIGGDRMQEQGLSSLFSMQELSLMGIAEIFPKIPHLLKRIRQTADAVEVFQPDILLTIDAPDFSSRVAEKVKKRGMEIGFKAHYVAPTVWAWRPKRAQKVASLYDGVLCLFPFEPPYFEKEGMKARFVGHPMSTLLKDINAKDFAKTHSLNNYSHRIGLLPGSRNGEVDRMTPIFLEALERVIRNLDKPVVICPTLSHLEDKIKELIGDSNIKCDVIITADKDMKYQAMKACDVAIATSGTVGLELSVLKIPHFIGYQVNRLTYEIGKRLIQTPYAHLTNIILQKPIVQEFIQDDLTVENLEVALKELIENDTSRQEQIEAFEQVLEQIKGDKKLSPSDACADFLIENFKAA